MALSPLEQAAMAGHDPSQRSQILDSRSLAPSEFNAPNWLEQGGADNGYGSYGSKPLTNVPLYAGSKYVLYDDKTHKVLGTASSADEIKALLGTINNTLVPQGKNASWKLYDMGGAKPDLGMHSMTPGPLGTAQQINGEWGIPIAGDAPDRTLHDVISGLSVPAIAAVAMAAPYLFPALQGAGGAAGGLGSITGSSAAAATLPSLAGTVVPVGTGIGAGLETGVGATLAAGLGTAGEVVVPGIAGASGIGLGGGAALGGAAAGGGALATSGGASGSASSAGQGGTTDPNEIVVSHAKPPVTGVPDLPPIPPINPVIDPGVTPPLDPYATTYDPNSNEIEVKGKPPVTGVSDLPPITPINPVIDPGVTPPLDPGVTPPLDPTKPHKPWLSTSELIKLLSGLAGGLAGGAGGKGGDLYPGGGSGDYSPIFSKPLPKPSLPGGLSTLQARVMPEQNWYEYGFHPEQSFFNTSAPGYVPQPGKTPGMAHGGDFSVKGPGTGRSDSIPARLSDGEYVVDAETVSLLGDGSTKAGAQKLDQFRVNLRKQKGRNLAQGRFSVKAKAPEAYLAGGRT